MRNVTLIRWSLLLALLFSQGLAVAHAFDHDLLEDRGHCATCIHGQSLDDAVAAAPAPGLAQLTLSVVIKPAPQLIAAGINRSPCIRGPPRLI